MAAIARAVWFPQAGSVDVRDEDVPPVGLQEVRVQALASGISHGTEMLVYNGRVSPDLPLDLPSLRGSFAFPIKYGYASAGRVVEVGATVEDRRPGDLVFVHHPHQTEYVVPAAATVSLDPALRERGAFLANLETAVNVMLDAAPRLGERVLIFGQGVIGLLLTQLASRCSTQVLAVEPFALRRELALRFGARTVLQPGEALEQEVRDLTDGAGADVVIEASGNPGALDQALRCAAFQGAVVACSWYGTKPAVLDLGGAFHRRRLRVVSSQVSNIDPALTPRWSRERRLALARNLLAALDLESLITHRFPIEAAQEAYDLVSRRPEECVQVLFTYGEA